MNARPALAAACALLVGACASAPADVAAALEPTGDPDLDELRRLAVAASDDELFERRMTFLGCLLFDYPNDPWLWRGFHRLCDAALARPEFEQRRIFCIALAQVIENDPRFTAELQPRVGALRSQR